MEWWIKDVLHQRLRSMLRRFGRLRLLGSICVCFARFRLGAGGWRGYCRCWTWLGCFGGDGQVIFGFEEMSRCKVSTCDKVTPRCTRVFLVLRRSFARRGSR